MVRTALILAVLAAGLAGCAGTSRIDVPEAFVTLDEGSGWEFDLRAVSADGVVLAVRTEENKENGTLAFWAQAVENELTGAKGYALAKANDVTTDAGRPARRMEFTAEKAGVPYGYIIVMTADERSVRIAEAGGPADKVELHRQDIDKALLSVR